MNSNRTKYASTPTYGMQKRNFNKKQAAAQDAPTPDFTQQPMLDMNAGGAAFSAQNPFGIPQGAIPGGNTSAEFASLIDREHRKWAQVVKASGAKVD